MPVQQPFAGVDFVPQSGIYEFGYCLFHLVGKSPEPVFVNLLRAQESIPSLAESIPGLLERLQIWALVDVQQVQYNLRMPHIKKRLNLFPLCFAIYM